MSHESLKGSVPQAVPRAVKPAVAPAAAPALPKVLERVAQPSSQPALKREAPSAAEPPLKAARTVARTTPKSTPAASKAAGGAPAAAQLSATEQSADKPLAPNGPSHDVHFTWAANPAALSAASPVRHDYIDDVAREAAIGAVESYFKSSATLKPLLLVGPPGAGRTCLIESAAARYCKLPLERLDEQDLEDYLAPGGLKPRGPALIDGIEALDASERAVVRAALPKVVKGRARALVLVADDIFDEPAKSWKAHCTVVRLERPGRAFVLRLLRLRAPKAPPAMLDTIADAANGSTALAMNSLQFAMKKAGGSTSATGCGGADALFDVPRAIGTTLRGGKVQCLGGSSDTAFFAHMVALQLPQTGASVSSLAKAMDRWSFYDASGVDRLLDTESHWDLVSMCAAQGPKLAPSAKWTMEWPKSTKAAEKPWYGCETGYVSRPPESLQEA